LSCSGQTLASSGRRRARAAHELRAEWAQLEMQLVVARVAAVAAVASEASARFFIHYYKPGFSYIKVNMVQSLDSGN
jgi:hypothetical protein